MSSFCMFGSGKRRNSVVELVRLERPVTPVTIPAAVVSDLQTALSGLDEICSDILGRKETCELGGKVFTTRHGRPESPLFVLEAAVVECNNFTFLRKSEDAELEGKYYRYFRNELKTVAMNYAYLTRFGAKFTDQELSKQLKKVADEFGKIDPQQVKIDKARAFWDSLYGSMLKAGRKNLPRSYGVCQSLLGLVKLVEEMQHNRDRGECIEGDFEKFCEAVQYRRLDLINAPSGQMSLKTKEVLLGHFKAPVFQGLN